MYLDEIAREIRREINPQAIPRGANVDQLFRFYAVLLLALGEQLTEADVHNAWVAWMAARDASHPALVPFDSLDSETAESDAPFVEAIRKVARRRADHQGA